MKAQLLYILSLWILFSCSGSEQGSERGQVPVKVNEVVLTAEQMNLAEISSAKPEIRDLIARVKVNGVIGVYPEDRVSISVPFGGYVQRTRLVPGTRIRKGEVLAVMEDPQYIQMQQDYLLAKARLEFLEGDYERQRILNQDKTSSDKTFQQVRSDFLGQRILLASLRERLKLLNIAAGQLDEESISKSISIYAPVSGIVTSVNVNPGRYVEPSDVMFEIMKTDRVHLSLTVFEKDLYGIKEGLPVTFSTVSDPEKKYNSRISLINPRFDAERKTEVFCEITDSHSTLIPGMFVSAQIQVEQRRGLVLPDEALVRWQNRHFVFLSAGNNTFRMLPVETGPNADGYTMVAGDLDNSEVVVRNAYRLLMKMQSDREE